MNILIPYKWLLEHLETDASVKEIQDYLSLSGPSVERIYDIEGDKVFDIEITTNRVDAMSIRGIAREANAILKQFSKKAKLKPLNLKKPKKTSTTVDIPEVIDKKNLANRVLFAVLVDIKEKQTPEWMQKRLKQAGFSINGLIIDITNYITHELGHPVHAFDYDKIKNMGNKIYITEAKKGEKFTTLENKTYTTVGKEIVFKNQNGEIIDIPSIIGTKNTSIDENTKNILLWIENIYPPRVRFTSMTHNIRTNAAQLAEKQLDPSLATDTFLLGLNLYLDLAKAKLGSDIIDIYKNKTKPKTIKVTKSKIDSYLGLDLDHKQIINILQSLEFKVVSTKTKDDYLLKVTPPSFRTDISIKEDIIEEIARIYGYHNIPSVLMTGEIPLQKQEDVDFETENKVKHFLADIGYQELYTYSAVSKELALRSGFKIKDHLKLLNPLVEDNVYLRRAVWPSLEKAILDNKQKKDIGFFELADIYIPRENDLPIEELHCSIATNKHYTHALGDMHALFNRFFMYPKVIPSKKDPNTTGNILVDDEVVGKVMYLPDTGIFVIDIIFKYFLKHLRKNPTYKPKDKIPPIIEDLTFEFKQNTHIGLVIEDILSIKYIKQVELIDSFRNRQTLRIKYLNPKKQLTATDVKDIRENIIDLVKKKHNGTLIGEPK